MVIKGVRWGFEEFAKRSLLLSTTTKNPAQMDLAEVKREIRRYDEVLGWLEEETDLDYLAKHGMRDLGRQELVVLAERAKTDIAMPGGNYSQLIDRFIELAQSPSEKRAANLRIRRNLIEAIQNQAEFARIRDAAKHTYGTTKIRIPDREVSLAAAANMSSTHPNSDVRKALYFALREQLEGLEAAVHEEVRCATRIAQEVSPRFGTPFSNFVDVRAYSGESPDTTALEAMIQRFIEGTRDVYNQLARQLISDEKVLPWDYNYEVISKDPFYKLAIPTKPFKLLGRTLDIFEDLGYTADIREFYNHKRPGVYLDIEKRPDKKAGATTCSLGPFSLGKNALYYNPLAYRGNPRARWSVFPHELGHGVHHHFSRRAAEQDPIFFYESVGSTETLSTFHEKAAQETDTLAKYLGLPSSLRSLFGKWKLFLDLKGIYGDCSIILGEIAMHRKGVEHARTGFFEAGDLTLPDIVQRGSAPNPAYVAIPHLHTQPGYFFGYLLAKLNQLPITQALIEKNRTVFHQDTARQLIDHIMTGNEIPMEQRIARMTGTTDVVAGAVDYFRDQFKKVRM